MDRLYDQLIAMDLSQLLKALRGKLENIRCILRCYPETRLALHVAIERLEELRSASPMTALQPQQNQSRGPKAKNLREILEGLAQAMSYSQEQAG